MHGLRSVQLVRSCTVVQCGIRYAACTAHRRSSTWAYPTTPPNLPPLTALPPAYLDHANKKGRGVDGAETVGNGSYRRFYSYGERYVTLLISSVIYRGMAKGSAMAHAEEELVGDTERSEEPTNLLLYFRGLQSCGRSMQQKSFPPPCAPGGTFRTVGCTANTGRRAGTAAEGLG
jgi:hypothetical protein